MFERGATDEFVVTSMDPMGEMITAHVYLENSGMGDSWYLEVGGVGCHFEEFSVGKKWYVEVVWWVGVWHGGLGVWHEVVVWFVAWWAWCMACWVGVWPVVLVCGLLGWCVA